MSVFSGLVDVRNSPYNADPSGNTDTAAAVQRAVDDLAAHGGGDAVLVGGGLGYAMSAPPQMRNGCRLLGVGGAKIVPYGGYAGPGVTVGLPGAPGQFGALYRPLSNSVYDSSALPVGTNRYALATRGLAAAVVTSHPIQFGYTTIDKRPDYWAGVGKLCLDIYVERPAGPAWPNGAAICGLGDSFGQPRPWAVRATTNGFWLDLKGDEPQYRIAGGWHRLFLAADMSQSRFKIILQADTSTDTAQGSVNGSVMADLTRVANFPAAGQESIAGLSLLQSNGVQPFMIGYLNDLMDARAGGFTDLTLYGLQVNRGLKYQWGVVPTLTTTPSIPVTDAVRYFTAGPQTVPANSYVANLPLNDAPTSDPWLDLSSAFGRGLLFWAPPVDDQNSPADVAIEGLEIQSPVQPAVLMGQHLTLRIHRVKAQAGCQALGSLPLRNSYVVYVNECDLEGTDAALASYSQIGEVRATQIGGAGRQALRFTLGEWLVDGVKVNGSQPWTESVVTVVGGGDGVGFDFRRLLTDNEGFDFTGAAFILDSGQGGKGSVRVTGYKVSTPDTVDALVRLVGAGLDRCQPCRVSFDDLMAPSLKSLHVVGPLTFYGDFNARSLAGAAKVVDVAGADARINYTAPDAIFP